MCHHLNIDPKKAGVRQKRRPMGGERAVALKEEVDRLLNAKLVRESFYPDWLANPILVKKPNGKWRTCVDFIDLNNVRRIASHYRGLINWWIPPRGMHYLVSWMLIQAIIRSSCTSLIKNTLPS